MQFRITSDLFSPRKRKSLTNDLVGRKKRGKKNSYALVCRAKAREIGI